jgi:hypothetical protein
VNKHIYNAGAESKGGKLRVEIIIDNDPDATTNDILEMLNYGGLHGLNSRYEITIEPLRGLLSTRADLKAELKKLLGNSSKKIKDEDVMVIVGELLYEFHLQCYGDPKYQGGNAAARQV